MTKHGKRIGHYGGWVVMVTIVVRVNNAEESIEFTIHIAATLKVIV